MAISQAAIIFGAGFVRSLTTHGLVRHSRTISESKGGKLGIVARLYGSLALARSRTYDQRHKMTIATRRTTTGLFGLRARRAFYNCRNDEALPPNRLRVHSTGGTRSPLTITNRSAYKARPILRSPRLFLSINPIPILYTLTHPHPPLPTPRLLIRDY
jgi:hypothetical protein